MEINAFKGNQHALWIANINLAPVDLIPTRNFCDTIVFVLDLVQNVKIK